MPHTPNTPSWPELPALVEWHKTLDTVHMWVQMVGKVRLELGPWISHSWGSALYVTPRGLTTSPIACQGRSFSIDFDFIDHALAVRTSDGGGQGFALRPMAVADFYRQLMDTLGALGIEVDIFTRPVEVENAIPFESNTQDASYDADAMHRFWQALVQADRVFNVFRARYLGKVSPVHVFWGSFDLAVTRFTGRMAPLHPGGAPNCADWAMHEAYSHELSSAGFWAGTGIGEAAFYAYAYPAPQGFAEHPVQPEAAFFTRTWASSFCPTKRCALPRRPTTRCWLFCKAPTKRRPRKVTGTALRWNTPQSIGHSSARPDHVATLPACPPVHPEGERAASDVHAFCTPAAPDS